MIRRLERWPLHPFLFALYPVLGLLAVNLEDVPPQSALRPLVVSLALAGLLLGLTRLVLRRWTEAAVLTSLTLLLLFAYGHVYALLRTIPTLGPALGHHRYLVAVLLLLLTAGTVILARHRVNPPTTLTFNVVGLLLVGLVLAQLIAAAARNGASQTSSNSGRTSDLHLTLPAGEPARDVYYIILDAYTRADVLKDVFGFANQGFVDDLEALGFRVASDSRSNYAMTRLSLTSSLNMDYLGRLGPPLDLEGTDASWLDQAAKYGAVRVALEDLGYQVVAVESAYGITDWVDADLYISRRPQALANAGAVGEMTPFEVLLLQTSIGRLILDGRTRLNAVLRSNIEGPNEQHRERILFALTSLENMADLPGPKFVFVHIMSPHPPYAFTADGGVAGESDIFSLNPESETLTADTRQGYLNQISFLNTRILQAVQTILEDSKTDPIIVIQGDHGALGVSPEDRMKILNAYYLPEGGTDQLYDSISPVNTFRLILNEYFGADLALLEDRSTYSPFDHPFQFTPIP
jgi:hypothetical protein